MIKGPPPKFHGTRDNLQPPCHSSLASWWRLTGLSAGRDALLDRWGRLRW
jgi:hypothetical protein